MFKPLANLKVPKVKLHLKRDAAPKNKGDEGGKFNLEKIKQISRNNFFGFVLVGFIAWLATFILSEILISGGLYARSPYLIMTQIVAVLCALKLLKMKPESTMVNRKKFALANLIVFLVCDYLVIFLLFESSNRAFFQFWGTWVLYGVVVIFPFINLKKREIQNLNIPSLKKSPEDDLLTKDNYSI